MKLGVMVHTAESASLASCVAQVTAAAEAGVDTVWLSQVYNLDALTVITVAGSHAPGVELGTAVVPTYPRHPLALAGQAMTTQAAVGGRLVLGVGPSHQLAVEGMLGLSYQRPARHTREYVTVLRALTTTAAADFSGELLEAHTLMGPRPVSDAPPFPILISALAPAMLRVAGEVADGTITWMAGPTTVAKRIVPSIRAAAAGRPDPRVVVGLPVSVTADPDGVRARAAEQLAVYGMLPVYRRLLDEEGVNGPADLAIIGDEETVAAQIGALVDAGATDFLAGPVGSTDDRAATLALLGRLAAG